MNTVRAIQRLNERELKEGIAPSQSWHTDYRDTAFIYIGGLPFELSEGDIITMFSQYGEPVWVKLARDKETGKSRGFCWLKYEDQRSCDLAVDNLGGANVMDRVLRVDHTRYKPRDDEDMRDNTMGELEADAHADEEWDSHGGRRKRRRTDSESDSDEDRPMLPEEVALEKLMRDLDDDDPMKASMVQRKQEEVDAAVKRLKKSKKKQHPRRHHRNRDSSRERDRDRRRIKGPKDEQDEHRYSKSRRDDSRDRDHRHDHQDRERRERRDRDRDRDRDRHRHSSTEDENKLSKSKRPSRRGGSHEEDRGYRRRDKD